MQPSTSNHRELTPPTPLISSPGSLAWALEDQNLRALVQNGVKVRIKVGQVESYHRGESACSARLILSLRGAFGLPGRRLAEIESRTIDSPILSEPQEILSLKIYGPVRKLFHRERLFDDSLPSREMALTLIRELVNPQIPSQRNYQ